MSETLPYPAGIEYRLQRPRDLLGGALIGALAAYYLTQNPAATAAAGALGAAIGNQPLTLNESLRRKYAEKDLNVVSFYRLGRFAAKILFRHMDVYWTLESHAPQQPEMTLEQIEDWLYGDLVKQVEDFLHSKNGNLRLSRDS